MALSMSLRSLLCVLHLVGFWCSGLVVVPSSLLLAVKEVEALGETQLLTGTVSI